MEESLERIRVDLVWKRVDSALKMSKGDHLESAPKNLESALNR